MLLCCGEKPWVQTLGSLCPGRAAGTGQRGHFNPVLTVPGDTETKPVLLERSGWALGLC